MLNLFRMLALMSGDRVGTSSAAQVPLDTMLSTGVRQSADVDAFATRADHEASVLVWNYHDVDGAAEAARTQVTLRNLPANVHRVLLEHYRIDDTHSNAYTVWKAMGSPQHPSTERYAELKAAGQLALFTSPEWLDVTNGRVKIATTMPRQATSLLHLHW